MSTAGQDMIERWNDAVLAAALFAIDTSGLGGVVVRARLGPMRDLWLEILRANLPPHEPVRRCSSWISDDRLLGGLDLTASLAAGRPIVDRGLLVDTDRGVVILTMAERLSSVAAGRLAAVLDTGEVMLERDGLTRRFPARIGIVALDESVEETEGLQPALLDRLAFHLELDDIRPGLASVFEVGDGVEPVDSLRIAGARELLTRIEADDRVVEALCQAAAVLGITSPRVPLFALRAARSAAALAGRDCIAEDDVIAAARLVLSPRATRLPTAQAEPQAAEQIERSVQKGETLGKDVSSEAAPTKETLGEVVVAATLAAIPPNLLERLAQPEHRLARMSSPGRSGAVQRSSRRGRPTGSQPGHPQRGARLDLIATLSAAAPWQRLRGATWERDKRARGQQQGPMLQVRQQDFRVVRYKQHTESLTIFVVDASGSSALHRLAEAKGAVEILLADCYVRRDQVALIAFGRRGADVLLAPTRSLARAKRCLAALPGGGGTPLASGLDAAVRLAWTAARKGQSPIIVVLTDGRANVARDGKAGRVAAKADALDASRAIRAFGLRAFLIDASPQPAPPARALADAMGASYLALPYADASRISSAVRLAATSLSANEQRP